MPIIINLICVCHLYFYIFYIYAFCRHTNPKQSASNLYIILHLCSIGIEPVTSDAMLTNWETGLAKNLNSITCFSIKDTSLTSCGDVINTADTQDSYYELWYKLQFKACIFVYQFRTWRELMTSQAHITLRVLNYKPNCIMGNLTMFGFKVCFSCISCIHDSQTERFVYMVQKCRLRCCGSRWWITAPATLLAALKPGRGSGVERM